MVKRMTCCILALFFLLLCLPACRREKKHTDDFFCMGTPVSVTLYGTDAAVETGFAAARNTLGELDRLWSRTIEGSDISRLNRSETGIPDADARTAALVEQAIRLSEITGGCFDVTLAPLSALWQTCGEEDRLPTDAELAECLALAGSDRLRINGTVIEKPEGVQVDLGGIAKGAAVSILIGQLKETEGLSGGLVSMGSCVAGFGEKPDGSPFRVSIRDPKKQGQTIGILSPEAGQVLSVSGDYERFVTIGEKNYHHILDPKTGYPTQNGLSSVAVVTSDGATADALSTALMVMGEEVALAFYRSGEIPFEAVLIRSDGSVCFTDQIRFLE